MLPSDQRRVMKVKQSRFAYFSLEKALEKQSEKQVGAIKSLGLSNKKDELKQIDPIFLKKC